MRIQEFLYIYITQSLYLQQIFLTFCQILWEKSQILIKKIWYILGADIYEWVQFGAAWLKVFFMKGLLGVGRGVSSTEFHSSWLYINVNWHATVTLAALTLDWQLTKVPDLPIYQITRNLSYISKAQMSALSSVLDVSAACLLIDFNWTSVRD